jgi:hypothetical protein
MQSGPAASALLDPRLLQFRAVVGGKHAYIRESMQVVGLLILG